MDFLPDEILIRILYFLAHPRSLVEFFRFKQVSWRVHSLCEDYYVQEQLKQSLFKIFKETFSDLAVEISDWYRVNKPLCTSCGRSAKRMFRIPNFVLSPMVEFVCPECTQTRRKFEGEHKQKHFKVEEVRQPKQLSIEKVLRKRETLLKEEEATFKLKEKVKEEAKKMGLHPKLATIEVDRTKTSLIPEILENVKSKKQKSESFALKKKAQIERRKELSVLMFPKAPKLPMIK